MCFSMAIQGSSLFHLGCMLFVLFIYVCQYSVCWCVTVLIGYMYNAM